MAKYKPWVLWCFILIGFICIVTLLCLCFTSFLGVRCSSGSFKQAAVAADSQICSEIGRNMLQQGGSAVDGAIAALLCTSVVNPQSMGIGGGSIITIRDKKGNIKVYNFRETVPQSFRQNLLKECPTFFSFSTGSQWVGVPGELRGYEAIHEQYGKLPWARLFEPTIKLAREGIPLSPYLGKIVSFVKRNIQTSSLCEIFCHKNKTVLSTGEIVKFSKLAETMETIAEKGAEDFYTGKIGHDLIQDITAAGGTLTIEDLRSFQVQVQDAWTVPLGDAKLYIPPPPAGGALLAFILKLMEGFSLTPNSLVGDKKIEMYHHFIEAVKFANGQKKSICDPKFNNGKCAEHLIDPTFIDRIRKMISSNMTHDNSYYNVAPSSDHIGTTHVSVLDEDGLAVSATSTINQVFGGMIYSPRTGIILNNELADFCGRADTLRAGERPPSSMSPVILESKSGGLLIIGGSGGSLITPAMALSIINHQWLGMSLKDAITERIIFIDSKNDVNFEPGFDESVSKSLKEQLKHKTGNWQYFLNVVNAVEKENNCIAAVSDSRKMGMSAGY
ncbi:glutathione hydrolase 5 proenzyme [Astatotilapia calliptera]|uniref:Glutathione hydrolase n=1 Tax=Astatotilapia calliptera TaxID=8154 RepID=A0AAX7U5U5_ASTCA|nr:glutathione hydrolase 5 proenzyme-like [Astatotilapia calliptera]